LSLEGLSIAKDYRLLDLVCREAARRLR